MILPALMLALQARSANFGARAARDAGHPVAGAAQAPVDSAARVRLLQRARREEQKFFYDWRHEWARNRDIWQTEARYFSLHCHGEEAMAPGDQAHLIRGSNIMKSMCPIWWDDYRAPTHGDEALALDNGLKPDSRARIRIKRAAVIRLLDSASLAWPNDPWLVSQRARLDVDQGEFERALRIVRAECEQAEAFCAMLEGYVLRGAGDRAGSISAFMYAASEMTARDRCLYLDPTVLLPESDRKRYGTLTCAQRDSLDARFWWLSDPLFMQPGNERLAEHLYRRTLVMINSSLTADTRFDWRVSHSGDAVAEMLIRYGWPSASFYDVDQSDNHFSHMGFRDSSVNASREYFRPRYHTTPALDVVEDLHRLTGRDLADVAAPWDAWRNTWDTSWWPVEHMARSAPLTSFDYQVAIFRRDHGPLITAASDPTSYRLPAQSLPRYTAAIVAERNPADTGLRATTAATPNGFGGIPLVLAARPGLQVVSLEVLDVDDDALPAGRARFAITAPPGLDSLARGAVGVSDVLLFAETPGSLPGTLAAAVDRMLPTTDFIDRRRIGAFVELYGVSPRDSVDVRLRITPIDPPGFLRRFGIMLGAAEARDEAVEIPWTTGQADVAFGNTIVAGVPVQSRSIILDLSKVDPGRYSVEVIAARAGSTPVTARRELRLGK